MIGRFRGAYMWGQRTSCFDGEHDDVGHDR
jgi:hypothetical protein